MWGENASNTTSVNTTTSVGGFWEEPTRGSTLKTNNALGTPSGNKAISKSQTVSHIQTQPIASKQSATATVNKAKITISTTSTTTNNNNAISKKVKPNSAAKKTSSNNDSNGNNEFTAWCSKALSAHVDVVDSKYYNVYIGGRVFILK